MSTGDTIISVLGAGGGFSGVAAVVKSFWEKGGVKRELAELKTSILADVEHRIADALAQLPALERRADLAILRLENALRSARSGRANTGDHSQVAGLIKDIEGMKSAVDTLRISSPDILRRLDTLEDRFESFERAYHDDYAELVKELAGVVGEFRAEMRRRHGGRPDGE